MGIVGSVKGTVVKLKNWVRGTLFPGRAGFVKINKASSQNIRGYVHIAQT
jgi:hypothetical protein